MLPRQLMAGMKANAAKSVFGAPRTGLNGVLDDVTGRNPGATNLRSRLRVL